MKNLVYVVVCSLTLLAVPALAEEVASQPAGPVFEGAVEPAPLCRSAEPLAVGSDQPVTRAYCSITVDCYDGSTRSCSDSTSPASCEGVDASCPGEQGWVQCNGAAKTFCPACPSCPDPNCPAGSYCTSHSQCGPCGGCINRRCICIA